VSFELIQNLEFKIRRIKVQTAKKIGFSSLGILA